MTTPRKTPRTNIERLNHEGFEIDPNIPKAYANVIEDLRPDEIELIIDVTRRLERAKECDPDQGDYVTFMHSF
jgi:hypothetical protein